MPFGQIRSFQFCSKKTCRHTFEFETKVYRKYYRHIEESTYSKIICSCKTIAYGIEDTAH